MNIKVLICLTPLCWEELRHLDSRENIILTDLTIDGYSGHLVRPNKDDSLDSQIFDDIKSIFKIYSDDFSQENFTGFINIFYECSMRPIASFIDAIDSICKTNAIHHINFYFSTIYTCNYRFSTYFMAEYESQGYRLYCRNGVLGSYLVDYINILSLPVRALNYRKINPQIIYSQLRVYAVFFTKLAWSICRLIRDINFNKEDAYNTNNVKRLIIVRSKMQLSALKNYILNTTSNVLICVGESYLDRGSCFRYARGLYKFSPQVQLYKLIDLSPRKIFSDYFFSFMRIKSSIKNVITYRGVSIDLTFAFKEIQTLVPELNSYKRSLNSCLSKFNASRSAKVFSAEQKTPHAFVDASLASKYGLTIFHLMLVDQHIHKLPMPIFGDYFVCDSDLTRSKMASVHSGYKNFFIYIGTIRAIGTTLHNFMKSLDLEKGGAIGFFTQADSGAPHHYQYNFRVIDLLSEICSKNGWTLFLKLHPRDRISNYRKKISNIACAVEVFDVSMSSDDAIDNVDIVVSFPSAIILEAIYKNVPTIILGFGMASDPTIQLYWDERYAGCITSLSKMDERLLRVLNSDYLIYRNNLIKKLSLTLDCTLFDRSIDSF